MKIAFRRVLSTLFDGAMGAARVAGIAAGTGLAMSAQAAEPDRCAPAVVQLVGKHFGLASFDYPRDHDSQTDGDHGRLVAGVCEVSPTNRQEQIAAFAYDADQPGEKEMVIAVVNPALGNVIAAYRYTYLENPGGVGKLSIDTARYQMSERVRAFGVDITTGYAHYCGDGGFGPERTLYVRDGTSLRPVLEIFAMSSWRYIKGFMCSPTANDDGDEDIIEEVQIALQLADTVSNGYRDLIVTAVATRTDGKPIGNGKFRHRLRFDGQMYSTREMEGPFSKWESSGNHAP